jgi:Zn ribbon nucleic-acid-binding protein
MALEFTYHLREMVTRKYFSKGKALPACEADKTKSHLWDEFLDNVECSLLHTNLHGLLQA